MLTNRTQSRVSISGLTYNNLLEDAYNALRDSDEFKNNFTSFTSNTAERMIVELYAYMATQLANRLDQMGNELFVDTASAYGLSRLLKLVGAKIDFPAAASTDITVSTAATTDSISFTTGIGTADNGNDLEFLPNSFKSVTANNGTTWEFIERKVGENGEYVYDYTTRYNFTAPTQIYTIYEGTTHSYDYTIRSVDTDIITLPNESVIKDSVRIYYKQKVLKAGTTNAWEIHEFNKVDNFFTTSALTTDTGIYTIRNMGNGRCEICLKPYYNSETSESDIGKELLIMYRTGGGDDGNIAIGSITKTERFNTLGNNGATITGVAELTITNTTTGLGGKSELTADEIRSTVVNEVRNTKIAITEEDYEYLLPKYDSAISLIKCYGEKNEETADLAETYGYYSNPISVWLIILKYNKELYDAYINGTDGLTNRINDIQLSIFDINPRFDEQYQVNTASINQVYKAGELNDYYTNQNGKFYYSLPINEQGVQTLLAGDCEITATLSPYVDSSIENRRGVDCFRMYNNDATEIETWEELLALTNVSEGDVYRVSGEDPDGELGCRWECIQDITSVISDYTQYWRKVDFSYLYDNLVSTDENHPDYMFIQQTGVNDFTEVESRISSAYSVDWGDLVEKYESSTTPGSIDLAGITLVINGTTIVFSSTGTHEFASLDDLVAFINDKVSPSTYYIPLKANIASLDTENPASVNIESDEGYTAGTGHMTIKIGSDSAVNLSISESGISTYGALLTAINTAISGSSLNGKVLAVFNENGNNDCWDLWLICKDEFTYKDVSTDGTAAVYRYLLNHPDYELGDELTSVLTELTYDQADAWADYVFFDGGPIVEKSDDGDSLVLLFDNDGLSTLQITGVNAGNLRVLFGLSETDSDVNSLYNKRVVSVSLVTGDAPEANLVISMTSASEKLEEDIYINIFGGEEDTIKLGSYYENIDENLSDDTPQVIKDLLKREPLKTLYSTTYNDSGIDKYGCNYQLKFSTGLVEEQTYNELSSGNSPAYVTTVNPDYNTMRTFSSDEKLYIKVDGILYDGTGSFTLDNNVITVPSVKGYAEFTLSWFNSNTISTLIEAIVKTFEAQGLLRTPLLASENEAGDVLKLYTLSAAYYSSIDFGTTASSLINYLFGVYDRNIITSEEGQIDAEQIHYAIYSLTSYPAINKSMTITYTDKNGTYTDPPAVVPIGYSLNDFANNIANCSINSGGNNIVLFNNNRIILADLSRNAKIKIELAWNSVSEKNAWEKMFAKNTWSDFTITDNYSYNITSDTEVVAGKTYYTRSGEEGSYVYTPVENPTGNPHDQGWYEATYVDGSAVCEYTNTGDYYIDYNEGVYNLKIENAVKFPYGNIYIHMYEDYSHDHIVSENDGVVVYTDEYNWNRLMSDRRVMLTEHVYKQPRFIPFDLAITCKLPNTEMWSQTDYATEVTKFLREEYGVYSNNIGKIINPDDIKLNIKNSFANIRDVTVDYLGYDMFSSSTNMLQLDTKFNQQHILASNESSVEAVSDPDTGLISFETVNLHGLKLTFTYIPA